MSKTITSETVLHLYIVEKPTWSQIIDAHKQTIADQIIRGGWSISNGMRRGFLNCDRIEDIVFGYFALEGNLRVEQYDDSQKPKSAEQKSFERILFLLLLNEGIVVVQSIRIARYLNLSGPTVREALFSSLDFIFRNAGLAYKGKAKFIRYRKEYTKEQLFEIFEGNKISRVIIKDLLNGAVPDDIDLFNPDFDADAFLKAIINEDLGSTNQVEWVGENLQDTKISRGLLYAGNPSLIEGTDEFGEKREWEVSTPESIELELNTQDIRFPEDDLIKLLSYMQRKFGSFRERLIALKEQKVNGESPMFRKSNK